MKYEDLTVFDKDLIRSGALEILSSTAVNSRFEALSKSVLSCIHSCGFNLSKTPKDLVSLLVISLSNKPNLGSDEVIQFIFSELSTMGIELVLDGEREPTWSRPKRSWYTEYKNPKKPWDL